MAVLDAAQLHLTHVPAGVALAGVCVNCVSIIMIIIVMSSNTNDSNNSSHLFETVLIRHRNFIGEGMDDGSVLGVVR